MRGFGAACALSATTIGISAAGADAGPDTIRFRPEAFFVGRTHGEGCLKVMLSGCRKVTVAGNGHLAPGGELIIDQDVTEGTKPSKHRQWRLRANGAAAYVGTLSEADGPTTAVVEGNTLHVRFPMKGGLRAEQRLTLAPDGATVANHMAIRKFGIVVATLEETITKIGGQR
jgi:hypothetical protein